MNSFIGISKAHTTNLAVVAPGIAEALLATALGLVAAIPAVVIYNVFARWIAGYRALHADASAEILRLVSRDLDRGAFEHARGPPRRQRPPSKTHGVRLDHGDETSTRSHEINVTPFIDVILVLLIIFMIAAPLATVDVAVDLPAANAERTPRPDKPLFLTLKSDLCLAIDNDAVTRAALARALDAGDRRRQAAARVPARRQDGALWRADGADERAARGRLSACGAGCA